MEKNMTIQTNLAQRNVVDQVMKKMSKPVEMLRKYYSSVLERDLDMRQTWLLLNAQASFAFAVLPVESPLLLRAVCCGWFLHAVLKCREEL